MAYKTVPRPVLISFNSDKASKPDYSKAKRFASHLLTSSLHLIQPKASKMLPSTITTTILSLSLTTLTTTALPFSLTFPLIPRDTALTESQVLQIAPSSNTCDNPPAKGECATAKIAAKYTALSFDTYQVTSKAEQAAVISLMAFESDEFKYNKNHFPGVPGQGSEYHSPSPLPIHFPFLDHQI